MSRILIFPIDDYTQSSASGEQRLSDVDTWPSHIIGCLFLEFPTRNIIKRLVAFFYGNDISPSLAEGVYELCNAD